MSDTPQAKYRLEEQYRDALRELAERFRAEGRIRHASEANAVRVLVADAAEKILKKKIEVA